MTKGRRRAYIFTAGAAALAAGALLTGLRFSAPAGQSTAAAVERASAVPPPAPPPPEPIESSAPGPSSAPEAPPPPPLDPAEDDALQPTLAEQREALYRRMSRELGLSETSLGEIRWVFEGSPLIGQGNPAITRHPMKRSQCRAARAKAGLASTVETHEPCHGKNMVPLYDPAAGQTAKDARVCIDEFEFPDIACEYPVVYARAREAALLCSAVGKRLCDAHEWEGACAGALHPAEDEYAWGKPRPYATWLHNKTREIRWSYGTKKDHSKCATGSRKSPECVAGGWTLCGSNTYPAGSFPACVSPLGAADLNGNAAEHMNLPLGPEELASTGELGSTEMKGSWFIFAGEEAHEDDCRWRAKDWHPSKVMDEESHRNYHLGFRCCQDVDPRAATVSVNP